MTESDAVPDFDPQDRRPLSYHPASGVRVSAGRDETEYFLKVPAGPLLVLRQEERFLWELLDGTNSFAEIERAFRAHFGMRLGNADFAKFIAELIAAGAIERIRESKNPVRLVTLAAPTAKKVELAGAAAAVAETGVAGGVLATKAPRLARIRPERPKFQNPLTYVFDNSGRLLAMSAKIFWPIRYLSWLLIPLVLVAFLIMIKHSDELTADWGTIAATRYLWPYIWIVEHITTWSARLAEGVVIYGFGGEVTKTYVRLFMMFIRVKFDEVSVRSMPRRQRLWITATPLIWRAFCFALPLIMWIELRPTHPLIAKIAMFEASMGLASFFVCTMPLVPLYGYRFITILLNQENLYARAFALLKLKFRGRPAPYSMTVAERWGLVSMAVGTAIVSTLWVGNILYQANHSVINITNGFGGWFMLAILAVCIAYAYSLWRYSGKLRAMQRATRVRNGPPPLQTEP